MNIKKQRIKIYLLFIFICLPNLSTVPSFAFQSREISMETVSSWAVTTTVFKLAGSNEVNNVKLNWMQRKDADLYKIYRDNNLIVNSTPDQVMEKWFQDSDPLCQFVDEMTTVTNRDQDYDKELLFKAYKEWFDDQKYDERRKIITMEKFSRDIQQYGFIPSQCTVKWEGSEKKKRSARVPCYKSNRVWNDGQLRVAPQPPELKITSA